LAVTELVPDPENRRLHNPRNLDMVAAALREVGAARSIVIDEANVVLAGNGVTAAAAAGITRVRVIEAEGDELIAVRRRGLTAEQKRALAIYDNRTAELAEWSPDQLKADHAAGLTLEPWFSAEELAEVIGATKKPGQTDPDAVPPLRPTTICPGDLFTLGAHRLLCGDCLDAAVVERIAPTADPVTTVVTSPPYWTKQPYDDQPGETGLRAFIAGWAATWAARVRRRIQIQTGHTNNTLVGDEGPLRKILLDGIWQSALAEHGWLLRHRRVWGKGGARMMNGPVSDLIDESWELLLTFYRPAHNEGGQERVSEGWAQVGVWKDIVGEAIDGHPCPFPVALAERMIQLYSVAGDVVADPFGGSGTTIIACEQLARRAVAMELSPNYCQVIIDRWEAFTGQTAVKL
jgi:hypothetical protein